MNSHLPFTIYCLPLSYYFSFNNFRKCQMQNAKSMPPAKCNLLNVSEGDL